MTSTTTPDHLDDASRGKPGPEVEQLNGGESGANVAVRTYVLDTSVLLSDPPRHVPL